MTNQSTDTISPIPFVHYHCDCPDLKTSSHEQARLTKDPVLLDESGNNKISSPPSLLLSPSNSSRLDRLDENTAFNTGRHLLSPEASNYLYPLSRLYFCEDCHEIRCPCCVQDEIISYYCPNCLFEVPTASVKSEKNRCARNCFQCPICHNTLAVVASKEATSSSMSATNTGPYFLACNVCRWNSQEIGMVFEKPTSLALQLQKNEDALPDVQEFDHLKEHFEKHLRVNTPSLPSSYLSFSGSGYNKILGSGGMLGSSYDLYHSAGHHQQQQQMQGRLDDISTYETSVQVPEKESATLESLMGLRDMNRISTLAQRYTQLHDQPYHMDQIHPQRIHLCIKRSKRCRTCRHILIKPEQKAQATRFKIKLVAMNYIPNITITKIFTQQPSTSTILQQQQPLVLKLGVATQFALKFTNPLYEVMSVTLATPPPQQKKNFGNEDDTSATVNGRVTIISPHFTVNAYNETIEYDDEMYPLSNSSSSKSKPGISASWASGIYEKRNNYTSVIVEVIPEKPGEFKFPLLVTCNYKSDEDRMDVSSGDIDEEEIENIDMDSSIDGSRKANSSIRMDDDKIKSYSFWCLVGLGMVQS
ncbi:dynactin p62 family-domain-containing protein [Halteromyces radiatus]|uniref:dynactin p62 family-domain-containing protein n=1 Tax=Halteromyces radiatus TaxID=101107 RepID=UPI00221FD517|nr:dynactin p62 family-domain-containing protein [Halteromyces radiatus]KAI8086676.1 dynactin p62 family-domain-containing protein [Halteromyces radiatus]